MKFLYAVTALAATVMAAPEMFQREADLTCDFKCLAPVKHTPNVACPCSSQVKPCHIYNCQGGKQAIGGNNAQIFRQH